MESLETYLGQKLRDLGVPGFSVAVVKRDQTPWIRGFGVADIARETPVTPETVFMWFSLTKIATATAVMQLVEQEKLSLDDKVSEYIPDFPRRRDYEPPLVRHLLNHSSGLANPIPVRWVHLANEPGPDPKAFLNRLLAQHKKLRSNPGEKTSYSNIGYLALGLLIAETSGQSYKDYVVTKILKPLEMHHTNFSYTAEMLEKAATGYQKRFSAMSLLLPLMRIPKGIVGGRVGAYRMFNQFYLDGSAYGGLIGPVKDAVRLIQVHINGGRVDGVQVLSEKSVQLMQRISSKGDKLNSGFGWNRWHSNVEDAQYVQQIGGGAGFFNIMRIYPEESSGIVVMGNSTNYDIEQIISAVHVVDEKR